MVGRSDGSGDSEYTAAVGVPFVVTSASGKDGVSYAVLGGYNYQMGQVVLGVEGDFGGATAGKMRYTAITGDFLTAHSKWGGSIRGRLGYAADHALIYVTGGAAFVSNETSIPTTGVSIGGDGTRLGWTVGAGIDYAFASNWFTVSNTATRSTRPGPLRIRSPSWRSASSGSNMS